MRRGLTVLAALLVVVIASALVVVHGLDRPFVKSHVQSLALRYARVDVDYAATRVRVLGGIQIDDLVVRPAPAFRAVTPELARVAHVDVAWSGLHLERVTLGGVAVTLAIDDAGAASYDGLGPPPDAIPKPATPLSGQPRALLATTIPDVDVTDLSFTLVRTHAAAPPERTVVTGLALRLRPDRAGDRPQLHLTLGTAEAPLGVDVRRMRGDSALGDGHTKTFLSADLDAQDLRAVVDIEIARQSFVENLAATHVLHAEARVHFDEAARMVTASVENASLAGGAATISGNVALPDGGALLVHHVEGAVDAPRLLALLPADLVPVRLAMPKGTLRFAADELSPATLPRLGGHAKVEVSADVAGLTLSPSAAAKLPGDLSVRSAKLVAHVEPGDAGAVHARASLTAGRTALEGAGAADDLSLDADLVQNAAGAIAGAVTLGSSALAQAGPVPRRFAAKDGKIGVTLADLVLDTAAPLATRGDVRVTAEAASVESADAGGRRQVSRLALTAHTKLDGKAPWSLETEARAAAVHVSGARGETMLRAPVRLDVRARDVAIDARDLLATPGAVHAVLDAADVHVELDAAKTGDELAYTVDTRAASLGLLRAFVADASLPLERTGVTLRSRGRVSQLRGEAPALEQHADVRVLAPAYGAVKAHALALGVDSKGSALQHDAHGELRAEGLAVGETPPSDDALGFAVSLDRHAPRLDVHLDASGRVKGKVAAKFGFDRARRAITYDLDTHATELGPLAPLLAQVQGLELFDLSKLDVALVGQGAVLGVVSAIDDRGNVQLAPAPARTVHVDGSLGVRAKDIVFASGATRWNAPSFAFTAKLAGRDETRTARTHVEVPELHLASGPTQLDVLGVEDDSTLTVVGDLGNPEVWLDQHLTARSVKQDAFPLYTVGDATVSVDARRTKDGVIHVANLEVASSGGGSHVKLEGAIDPTELQRRLSLHGIVQQDLARLSNAPGRFAARGMATIGLRVESPDLATFRTVGDVRIEGADVSVPAIGLSVEGADGMVPVTLAFRVTPRGVRLLREDVDNPYSALRFADQHPLLRRSSFLSVRRFALPQVTIAPLVGNLQIEQNLVSLRQFEMGVRGGRVTGQMAFDWNGLKSTLSMHVRADGVQSSHGEPFTGNAALFLSAAEHSIEGRADILQIGERHLQDVLDLQDPFHADASINKIRSALKWGYPDRLRVTFDHGFASAHVTFGGLARFVSVGDVRGIPMGPLVDQLLYPILPAKDEP